MPRADAPPALFLRRYANLSGNYAALGMALYGNSAQMARILMIYAAEEKAKICVNH
jgi:hypothetical protein